MRPIRRNAQGFTIVELLIVIVVIAILAAVTTVAFNGIQARAENTKTVTAVSAYVKAIKTFSVDNDRYPINFYYPCLGSETTTCGAFTSGACFGLSSVSGNAAFVSDIKTVLTAIPQPSTQSISCNTTGGVVRGAYYYSANGKTAIIGYVLRGNVQCNQNVGLSIYNRMQSQDATVCVGSLPVLP